MKLDKYGMGAMRGALLNKELEANPALLEQLRAGTADARVFAQLMKNVIMFYADAQDILEKDPVIGPMIKGL